jgi:hypothetical protein
VNRNPQTGTAMEREETAEWCKQRAEFALKLTRKIFVVSQQKVSKAKEAEEERGKHKEANSLIVIWKS